ncbi:MAG: hypothetical protein HQM08_23530 [Candidatus Riflebacteria bacterium]|nr:hypothetical protein [Candidatus Riflebacteria bacterium]
MFKFRNIGIKVFFLIMLFSSYAISVSAQVYDGTSYLMLSKQFGQKSGIYRLTQLLTGSPMASDPVKLADLTAFRGSVVGLSCINTGLVYFLGSLQSAYTPLSIGSLPKGISISDSSSLYRSVLLPKVYLRWSEAFSATKETFWKKNQTISGITYDSVWSNGTGTNIIDIPMWDGIAGIQSTVSGDKWITPNGVGFLPAWAYGTPISPWPGKPLNGEEGRPAVTSLDFPPGTISKDGFAFAPVERRVFATSKENLDLLELTDTSDIASPVSRFSSILTLRNLIETIDLYDASGKDVIPGGNITNLQTAWIPDNAQMIPVGTEKKYFFSPGGGSISGDLYPPTLQFYNSSSGINNLALDSATIRNYDSLKTDQGIDPSHITKIAVSERYDRSNATAPDFIYGSTADKFIIQNSWWGNGGKAYEYDSKTGAVYRLDYSGADPVAQPRPTRESIGVITGAVDEIAVDGSGYLYALLNETSSASGSSGIIQDIQFDAAAPEAYLDDHGEKAVVGPWIKGIASLTASASGTASATDTSTSASVATSTTDTASDTIATTDTATSTSIAAIASGPSKPSEGDFSYVSVKQYINKRLVRYSPGPGRTLGVLEDRGAMEVGFDWLTRRREVKGGAIVWTTQNWEPQKWPDARLASAKVSLAVVQIPQRPVTYNQTASSPAVCRTDGRVMTEIISEGDAIKFKVEGYKPMSEGRRISLKDVGIIGQLGRVLVNLNPAPDGTYNYDEDNDGVKSGFPSSLFESDTGKTKISWNVDWVDGTNGNSVLQHVAVASDSLNDLGEFEFAFPQPGNFQVWADVSYKMFDYSTLQEKGTPSDLVNCVASKKTTTPKYLVQVQSPPSAFVPETYLSNITMLPEKGTSAGVAPATVSSGTNFCDILEGKIPDFLETLTNVQFVRDVNVRTNTDKPLETYAGVGVWHYDSYIDLMGLKLPKTGGLVYNYNTAAFKGSGLSNLVDLTKYNPGWTKQDDQTQLAKNGTQVDTPLSSSSRELDFMRWEIYAYPVYSKASKELKDSFDPKGKMGRGILLASGSFFGADPTDLGDRKYQLSKKIPTTDFAKAILVPLDPEPYRLRMEVAYPRVKWAESVASGETGSQYRSMVPDPEPVHVVGTILNPKYPTGNQNPNGTACFKNTDSWMLRMRDDTLIPPSPVTPGEILETTGDPTQSATMSFTIFDNNPSVQAKDFGIKYQLPHFERDSIQRTWNKIVPQSSPEFGEQPKTSDFMFNPDFKVSATYTVNVNEYGEGGWFEPGSRFQNWVGSLAFAIDGKLNDGIGIDGKNTDHAFTYPATSTPKSIETAAGSLTRIDNDPPSIYVTLVSPGDNRRWEFQAIEGVNDLAPVPNDPSLLASTTFAIGSFRLDDGTPLGNGTTTVMLPGNSDIPYELATENRRIDVDAIAAKTPLVQAFLPKIRRSGRLFINLDIDDNVDYKELSSATIDVVEVPTGKSLIPAGTLPIPLLPRFNSDNLSNPDLPSPRARYVIDMPMKVSDVQPQIKIDIFAQDAAGNQKAISIPVYLTDVSFDVKVIESKESRTK